MKVVYAGSQSDFNNVVTTGGERYNSEILKHLAKENVPVQFLATEKSPSRLIKRSFLLTHIWYACHWGRIPRGKDVLLLEDYSQRLQLFTLNILVHMTRKAKLVSTLHHFYFIHRKSFLKNILDKLVTRLFLWPLDLVIVPTQTVAKQAMLRMKVPSDKLKVVYNALRTEFIANAGIPQADDTHDRPVSLLFVGALIYRKGLEYLLEAIKMLDDQNLKLTVIGDPTETPSYAQRVFNQAERLRIKNQVDFAGYVGIKELIEFYKRTDILVLPSLNEGFGVILVEAMCFGIPIVATRAGAIPELVEDSVNGILVPPKNPRALAEAILTLVQNRELRQRMGERGFEKSYKFRRTWEDMGKECYQLLSALSEPNGGLKE